MPIESKYLLSVCMDVEPAKERLFNEVYDEEHVPDLLSVPGVLSIARFKKRELRMIIGGKMQTFVFDNEPDYACLYELQSPEVLTSAAWAERVDKGRWSAQVRPYTRNRRHILYESRQVGTK